VPEEWEVQITRIVQEALSNIRRHSGAETVRILLGRSREGRLRVLIEDDGSGLSEPSPGGAGNDHFGLAIMRERAAAIGAELCIESEPGEGTRVALELAVQESAGPAAIREGAP
jgi:two-component system nitrate/nitrite sensor histidine kinase NarX